MFLSTLCTSFFVRVAICVVSTTPTIFRIFDLRHSATLVRYIHVSIRTYGAKLAGMFGTVTVHCTSAETVGPDRAENGTSTKK